MVAKGVCTLTIVFFLYFCRSCSEGTGQKCEEIELFTRAIDCCHVEIIITLQACECGGGIYMYNDWACRSVVSESI